MDHSVSLCGLRKINKKNLNFVNNKFIHIIQDLKVFILSFFSCYEPVLKKVLISKFNNKFTKKQFAKELLNL